VSAAGSGASGGKGLCPFESRDFLGKIVSVKSESVYPTGSGM